METYRLELNKSTILKPYGHMIEVNIQISYTTPDMTHFSKS